MGFGLGSCWTLIKSVLCEPLRRGRTRKGACGQLRAHKKRKEIVGIKPGQRFTESVQREVGFELGLCGVEGHAAHGE